jgi:hypothetical protein
MKPIKQTDKWLTNNLLIIKRSTGEDKITCIKRGSRSHLKLSWWAIWIVLPSTLKTEAASPPELMPFYQNTQLHIPEHGDLEKKNARGMFQSIGATKEGFIQNVCRVQPPCCVTANAKTPSPSILCVVLRFSQERRVTTEQQWFGKGLEGSGSDLIEVWCRHCPGRILGKNEKSVR